jgi:hypothetical protein
MADTEKRSVSTLLGCGCAALVAIILGGVALVTFVTYRAGKRLEAMATDPAQAAAAVREVLPHEALPAGYAPVGTLSVPFLMDVAFLRSDLSSAEGESGFLFIRVRDWFGRGDRTRQWIETGESDGSPIQQEEIRFDPDEVVDRGELTLDGTGVLWVARRGMVDVDTSGFGSESERAPVKVTIGEDEDEDEDEGQEGVLTILSIDCPGDDRYQRIGIWFVPDPAPGTPAAEIDWSGTPADPAAIEELLGHFELCG